MKPKLYTKYLLIWLLLLMPGRIFSVPLTRYRVMEKLFMYSDAHADFNDKDSVNTYIIYNFQVVRRNPTLFFVPTMYYIARGRRNFTGEVYGRSSFGKTGELFMKEQVVLSTIPHKKKVMTTMAQYLTPNLYGTTLFRDNILSPFNHGNRRFYRYRVNNAGSRQPMVTFSPRLKNTQLVTGYAILSQTNGRVIRCVFRGENDMVDFRVALEMGSDSAASEMLPLKCEASATFRFLGNNIKAGFRADYNCPTTLPDSIFENGDHRLMKQLRPDTLTAAEREGYDSFLNERRQRQQTDTVGTDSGLIRRHKTRQMLNTIGDNLWNSLSTENDHGSIRLSPLVNPLYLSYSHSRGISYRLNLGAEYRFNDEQSITFNPDMGYSFKVRQLYYTMPLRYTFSRKHDSWLQLTWANGNRIANSSVLDLIRQERRDTIDFSRFELDYFKDELWQLTFNNRLNSQLNIELGTMFHIRRAVDKAAMTLFDKESTYKTLAPYLTLTWQLSPRWPVLTFNYERSLKKIFNSDSEYERMELDASWKLRYSCLRQWNFRLGGGMYTNRSQDYFVDFRNFHENYLPGGWDDDWSGEFQLLNSQWYNSSRYYIRYNSSYESPFMLMSWVPLIGRHVELERVYISLLQLEHSIPYVELGYGLTNRFFSMGIFTSIVDKNFYDVGCRFTIELFRKW